MRKELLTASALSRFVQERIQSVQPKAVPTPFSWRMAAASFSTDDSRVTPFLTSDQVALALTGTFTGINHARQWATRHFGYPSHRGVSAEAFGTGRNAGVRLTKNKLVHEAALIRCAELRV